MAEVAHDAVCFEWLATQRPTVEEELRKAWEKRQRRGKGFSLLVVVEYALLLASILVGTTGPLN